MKNIIYKNTEGLEIAVMIMTECADGEVLKNVTTQKIFPHP